MTAPKAGEEAEYRRQLQAIGQQEQELSRQLGQRAGQKETGRTAPFGNGRPVERAEGLLERHGTKKPVMSKTTWVWADRDAAT